MRDNCSAILTDRYITEVLVVEPKSRSIGRPDIASHARAPIGSPGQHCLAVGREGDRLDLGGMCFDRSVRLSGRNIENADSTAPSSHQRAPFRPARLQT